MNAERFKVAVQTAPALGRICALAVLDRLHDRRSDDDPGSVPTQITPGWLTNAICARTPGGRVLDVQMADGSSGTTYRQRLKLNLNHEAEQAGLPTSVFTKSTPTILQRITQAVTGPVEAQFYTRLRPRLPIEAPACFHGAIDARRMTAITVLEDLTATKQARFLDPTTHVTREMAEEIVTTLATLHATFAASSNGDLAFTKTYEQHWQDAFALVGVERYFLRCFEEAGELIAEPVRRDPRRAWNAVLRSIECHASQPATLLHNDVHLGNWYQTADGRMGLTDWQAVVRGHWSRDLAYALCTTLTIEDRRAWERDLVDLYVQQTGTTADAFTAYRRQLWGALAYWAPTYSPPRLMPSDMQPRSTSGELLRRITTACVDLDAFGAVGA